MKGRREEGQRTARCGPLRNRPIVSSRSADTLPLSKTHSLISQQRGSPVIFNGLPRKWSMPAALHSPSLSCVTFAVSAMMGRWSGSTPLSSSSRICLVAWKPSNTRSAHQVRTTCVYTKSALHTWHLAIHQTTREIGLSDGVDSLFPIVRGGHIVPQFFQHPAA